MTPRRELLQIQQKIFARNKSLILSHSLVPEKGFETYEKEYRQRVSSYQAPVKVEELEIKMRESRLVFVGDYHTNKQSQRAFIRLLRLTTPNPNLVIGLEIIRHAHQIFVDAYLKNQISESDFLKKIGFKEYWYFDLWENFKPIFDFAREKNIPIVGIEKFSSSGRSLAKRDEETAKLIGDYFEKHPETQMMVLMGDLHVSSNHLTQKTKDIFKKKKIPYSHVIVYQNCEAIYWKLAEAAQEHKVEVVRVRSHEYALMTTPPIIWQQSFLNWLENEEGAIDYEDAKHSFLEILKQVAAFLEIPVPHESEEVDVFTCGDFSFLKWLEREESFSKKDFLKIKEQILSSESYCIPQKKIVYFGNLSLNHAGEEAAHYLKFLVSGPEVPRDLVDAFYTNILHEALGFFGSKIINHKRKCFHHREYQNLIGYWRDNPSRERRFEIEMALLILQHMQYDQKKFEVPPMRYFRMKPKLFLGVTHGLGYILGDKLYYGLLSQEISKQDIRDLFKSPWREEGEPFLTYRRLLKKLKTVKIPRRV